MSSLFIQFVPVVVLTEDPIINALLGCRYGIGNRFAYAITFPVVEFRMSVLLIRNRRQVVTLEVSFLERDNHATAGLTLVGNSSSFYDYHLCSSRNRRSFHQTKRMQAMIVTSNPDAVIEKLQ